MKKVEKYIIRRVRIYHKDGTKANIKTTKEVFNIDSYREYLMAQYDAAKVEFIYYYSSRASRRNKINSFSKIRITT